MLLRIKNRGRENEQSINKPSLLKFEESLSRAIERFYDDVPLIDINTEQYLQCDYDKGFFQKLSEQVKVSQHEKPNAHTDSSIGIT